MKRAHRSNAGLSPRRRIAGFSLVELMVALLISLVLSAAALGILLSNRRVHGATEGLGRLQENARTAFELMARDIREAGGNPCDFRMEVANMLSDDVNWWTSYETGISGFDDGAFADSEPDTDAIRVQYFEDTGAVTTAPMESSSDGLEVNNIGAIEAGQILAACGFFPDTLVPGTLVPGTPFPLTIFSAGKAGGAITHEADDGNLSDDFKNAGAAWAYPAGTIISRLRALEWYVGKNDRGGTSLFRRQLTYPAGLGPTMGEPEEIIPDVTDLQFRYFTRGEAEPDDVPASWPEVTAVEVALVMEAADTRTSSVDGELIQRRLVHVIALRNKL